MYAYDELDRTLINERVAEFRDQVKRRLSGELTEDEFKTLRLKNGVYLQLHAYMLRVAIPYGTLSSKQLRALAHVARRYDRGYGHFTTRQNIQYNWIKLSDLPDALADLAEVGMHAHADHRQQHAQRHLRPVGGRRTRRDRGSAHLVGNPAPAHHAASGILVPAAQVQDRDHGVRARPRRDQGPRHRPASAPERRRRDRLRGAGRRRARPHAVHRQDHQAVRARAAISSAMSRRSCASTTSTAAATTSTRRASRSWCTSSASRSSRRGRGGVAADPRRRADAGSIP